MVKGLAVSALKLEGRVAVDETLIAAKRLAAQTQKKTTVIGSFQDTIVAKDWPNHNVLNLPRNEWTWQRNVQWIDDAIARGDDIYLATEPARAGPTSTFLKELDYLKTKGYVQRGQYMVRE